MTNILIKKSVLTVMIAALIFGAVPTVTVLAAEEGPPEQGAVSHKRLERIWARGLKAYERLGRAFERNEVMIEKAQNLIDRASENGRDVTALQAALDAFEAAVQTARPQYEELAEIVDAHSGFDADGKVTDVEQARATVKELGAGLKDVKTAMGGKGKALREAIKAFREANKPDEEPAERDS